MRVQVFRRVEALVTVCEIVDMFVVEDSRVVFTVVRMELMWRREESSFWREGVREEDVGGGE